MTLGKPWKGPTARRMLIMLLAVGLLFGGIFGWQAFQSRMMKQHMASAAMPPTVVSAAQAAFQTWQPQLRAVGSLRAARGVDVASEIAGLVNTVHFRSGDEVRAGQVLVQLSAEAEIAQLRALEAAAELAGTVYERSRKQFEVKAVSRATLDADAADLKTKRAQVAQQAALVEKRTIRAPFAGRLGIGSVNPGQYLNAGDRIVTLQALDPVYVDFTLPQQDLSLVARGQAATVTTDARPGKSYLGRVTAVSPKVDPQTRNVQVEALVRNPRRELLPGMYASVEVRAGAEKRYLTLPRTAVTFNPYGETVFVTEEKGRGADGKPVLTVRQAFVTLGPARGDQVAVLSGVKEGETVVTSGQIKLKTGHPVVVDNRVQPASDAAPKPTDP